MPLEFKAPRAFWKQFNRLSADQQKSAREKFAIFKANPFDPRLRPHKINRLTALTGKTVYAVDIEGDLRATFHRDGDVITSISIGTHEIYK